MTAILEADSTRTQAARHEPETIQTVSAVSAAPRRPFWRTVVSGIARLVPVPAPFSAQKRPELQAIDRLAQQAPYLYGHAISG